MKTILLLASLALALLAIQAQAQIDPITITPQPRGFMVYTGDVLITCVTIHGITTCN